MYQKWLDALRREQRLTRNMVRRYDRGFVDKDVMERQYDALSRAYLDASEHGPERLSRLYARIARKYAAAMQQHVT